MNAAVYYENFRAGYVNQFKNVLMIEDDQDLAHLVKINLEKKYNCGIQIAQDPFEAINLMIENFYDLILLDWKLPGLNGIETLLKAERSLKLEPYLPLQWDLNKIPVVIFSAAKKTECISRNTKHFYFDGYVSKDQFLENIIETLGEYILNEKKLAIHIA